MRWILLVAARTFKFIGMKEITLKAVFCFVLFFVSIFENSSLGHCQHVGWCRHQSVPLLRRKRRDGWTVDGQNNKQTKEVTASKIISSSCTILGVLFTIWKSCQFGLCEILCTDLYRDSLAKFFFLMKDCRPWIEELTMKLPNTLVCQCASHTQGRRWSPPQPLSHSVFLFLSSRYSSASPLICRRCTRRVTSGRGEHAFVEQPHSKHFNQPLLKVSPEKAAVQLVASRLLIVSVWFL